MKQLGHGNSHAKIILIGEHSVVYGQPAIALPLPSVTTNVSITTTSDHQQTIDSRYFRGNLQDLPQKMAGIKKLIQQLLTNFHGIHDGWHLEINSDIPAERGMGSSAACAVAIVRAFFDYYEAPLSRSSLLKWAAIEEQVTHRNPSGLDAATVSSEHPIWFKKGAKGTPIPLNLDATMVIADTGVKGATREAIQTVQERLQDQPRETKQLIHHLGVLSADSKIAIAQNHPDVLGNYLTAAQHDLASLGVSDQHLDILVEAALDNGALGAKLTGGGRGGCMFAITNSALGSRKIASLLKDHGAAATWIQPLNSQGD